MEILSHSGGTWGFSSNIVFCRELGVGLMMWKNNESGGLQELTRECLEILIPIGWRWNERNKFSLGKLPDLKSCPSYKYKHIMGDVIKLTIRENDWEVVRMGLREVGRKKEEGIRLEKVEEQTTQDGNMLSYIIKMGSKQYERLYIYSQPHSFHPYKLFLGPAAFYPLK